jgi:hypothetical protein
MKLRSLVAIAKSKQKKQFREEWNGMQGGGIRVRNLLGFLCFAVLSCLVLSCHVMSYLVLSCITLPYPIPYLTLPYLTLPYLTP